MAENKRPSIAVDTHPNIAVVKNQRTIAHNMLQSPMVGDRNYNVGAVAGDERPSVLVDTARMQLISPPPEEMLRRYPRPSTQSTPSLENTGASPSADFTTSIAKRKRTQPAPTSSTPSSSRDVVSTNQDNNLALQSPQPMETTPNPKPRKQGRLHSRQPSLGSPTRTSLAHPGRPPVSNDISKPHLLLRTKSSRRSATPIPPYEPPTDVFASPREVFLTPVLTKSLNKSSKRKTPMLASGSKSTKGKKKRSALAILTAVKQELPDIDLTLPMPPPSPTDDPLLLLGPPELEFDPEPTPPRRREMSVQVHLQQEVGIRDEGLPPSSPEPPLATDDAEAVMVFDWKRNENGAPETSTDESMIQLDPDDADISPVRLFGSDNVPLASNDGWSDSEDEGMQGTTVAPGDLEGEGEGQYTGHWKMTLVRTKQDPPSSATRGRMEEWGRPISPFPNKVARLAFLEEEEEGEEGHRGEEECMECGEEGREEEEEEEVRRMSLEPDQLLRNVIDSVESSDADRLRDGSLLPDIQQAEEEEEVPLSTGPAPAEILNENHRTEIIPEQQGEDDDQSSDDGGELSLVKITSADPRAAARAAAILKQHDYDCFTNIEVKRRYLEAKHRRNSHSDIEDFSKESRRRDISNSGVAKAPISSRRRRSTLGMGVIGDTVFIPGSPATTLPELLKEAEHEVIVSPQRLGQKSSVLAGRVDPFMTPIAAKYRAQTVTASMADQKAEVYGGVGEREWTKEDWKQLDACFTDQRLEVGSRHAGAEQDLAPVDIVSINDVVDKFVMSKGGFETVARFGALWSRENLLGRTRALQKKQRSGRIAAPRYSHLLDEAIAISQQGSTPSPEQEAQDSLPQLETKDTPHSSDVPSTTIGKRVKGFLFSYLPTLSKTSSAARKVPAPLQPSLPVPPIDILSKPRGPVITPARPPLSKPKHPKELVVLHPAPQPPKISHIPRMAKPRRLVELHPPAPLPTVEPTPIPRPRRSSGNSVKDLVRGFEELQSLTHDKLKRTKSNEGLKRYADRRPQWKP